MRIYKTSENKVSTYSYTWPSPIPSSIYFYTFFQSSNNNKNKPSSSRRVCKTYKHLTLPGTQHWFCNFGDLCVHSYIQLSIARLCTHKGSRQRILEIILLYYLVYYFIYRSVLLFRKPVYGLINAIYLAATRYEIRHLLIR